MSVGNIPKTMKRLVLAEPNEELSKCKFSIQKDVPVPELKSGEVLIKVSAAPINPSDYSAWRQVNPHDLPKAIGNEGCGVIVEVGPGVSKLLFSVGAKVGFVALSDGQGSYSEYVAASVLTGVFAMPNSMPVEDAASFFVNPYTAVGIVETARVGNSKCFIHTAAASQLGQMINKLILKSYPDMAVINVVRKEAQATLLKSMGAKHVVVTGGNQSWKDELESLVKKLDVTVAFDAVSGEMCGDLLSVLPPKGTLYLYGGLAGKAGGINPLDLIYHSKNFKAWLLTNWIREGNWFSTFSRIRKTSKLVTSGIQNGWSSSQFLDTTLENAHPDLLKSLDTGITGKKLRIRM